MSMRQTWTNEWQTQPSRLLCQLFVLLVALTINAMVQAQSAIPRLADNAPDTYVVKRGDTLWDISALF